MEPQIPMLLKPPNASAIVFSFRVPEPALSEVEGCPLWLTIEYRRRVGVCYRSIGKSNCNGVAGGLWDLTQKETVLLRSATAISAF